MSVPLIARQTMYPAKLPATQPAYVERHEKVTIAAISQGRTDCETTPPGIGCARVKGDKPAIGAIAAILGRARTGRARTGQVQLAPSVTGKTTGTVSVGHPGKTGKVEPGSRNVTSARNVTREIQEGTPKEDLPKTATPMDTAVLVLKLTRVRLIALIVLIVMIAESAGNG